MKVIFKFLKIAFLFVFGFLLLYALSALILSNISVEEEQNAKDEVTIYIITNGVHTDIVVPVKNELMDWSEEIKFSDTVSKDSTYNYLAMGWGDKGFYLETPTWAELKPSVAFNAAFGLGNTAIHTTFYYEMKVSDTCKEIKVSKEQYQRLVDYISSSFQKGSTNHWLNIVTKANYGNTDAFYEAKGSYSLFHTCNTWANNGLKSCGQKACVWTVLDTGIFSQYEE